MLPPHRGRQRLGALPLRHRMSLAMAAFLAVILGLSLTLAHHILIQSAEEAASNRLARAAREVALTAEAALERRVQLMEQAAAMPEIGRLLAPQPDPADVAAAGERLAELGLAGQRGAELWSAEGRRIAVFSPAVGTSPPLTTPEPPLHGPLLASRNQLTSWTVVPIFVDRARAGFLASEMRVGGPTDAERSLAELTGEALTLFMRNADGSVWGQPGAGPLATPPRRLPRALTSFELPGVGTALAAEADIEGTPWAVSLMTPLREVHAGARKTVLRLGLASLLLLGLAVLLAWAFGSALARPLISLARAADAMSAGDYSQRVHTDADDEVGRLAATFNHMAAQLEASRLELMRRVQEAQNARDEAERLRKVAEYARDHAERASRAKGDFLAVVSHELRTPLNAIGGYTQLLELGVHGPLSDEQQSALRRIAVNQAQLLNLIDEVLSYAQLEGGRVEFNIANVPLADVLARLEPSIAPQLQARRLHYEQQCGAAHVSVRADAARVQQILLNLLANAIKFTPPGGSISVTCDVADDNVSIHVHDTGIGIARERLHSIFEPFTQINRTHSNPAEGVGLGLPISRDLARGMDGDVHVTSQPGIGSTFTVVLPKAAGKTVSAGR